MKLFFRVATLLIATLLSIGTLSAQYTRTGKIVDRKGAPVPGARITAVNSTSANRPNLSDKDVVGITTSDINGNFVLTTPYNVDRVWIEYAGYKRINRKAEDNMKVKMKKAYKETTSLTFQTSFPDKTQIQPAYGGMFSWCRRVGFYMRGVGNMIPTYSINSEYTNNPMRFWHTGERRTSYMAFSGGLMLRTCSVLNIYAGGGYAIRKIAYEVKTMSGDLEYYLHPEHSYQSIMFDFGLILKLRPIAFTAGCSYVPNYGYVGNFGVGFCF